MRYRTCLAPVLALVCSLSSARADEFVSPEGFKLTYPEGWKAASKEQLDKIAEMAKQAAGSDAGIVGCIHGPRSEGYTPTVVLAVQKTPFPANENQWIAEWKSGYAAQGAVAPEFKTKQSEVDSHKLFSIAYQRDDPARQMSVRTWRVLFPTKNGSCTMTCTALKSQWAEAGPVFKSIINSLKFDGVPPN